MLNWLIGGAAVVFLGPKLLRTLADNPDMLRKAADATDFAREKAIDATKRGASYVTEQINQRRGRMPPMQQSYPAPMQGTFAGIMPGCRR